ncbi:hypothetical protein ALC57_00547 [Trachymyrmex cornetzi]|uniref:Uncharacterized protein n=1 Tax=Trachymyrmex cornetzi TaxID=471704 RepID=A0A151JRS5_9HYME|nr:hypothetical protein ALC57_00547 [Trachymyrmex cornetzi]
MRDTRRKREERYVVPKGALSACKRDTARLRLSEASDGGGQMPTPWFLSKPVTYHGWTDLSARSPRARLSERSLQLVGNGRQRQGEPYRRGAARRFEEPARSGESESGAECNN